MRKNQALKLVPGWKVPNPRQAARAPSWTRSSASARLRSSRRANPYARSSRGLSSSSSVSWPIGAASAGEWLVMANTASVARGFRKPVQCGIASIKYCASRWGAAQPGSQYAAFGEPLEQCVAQRAGGVGAVIGIVSAGSDIEQPAADLSRIPSDLGRHRRTPRGIGAVPTELAVAVMLFLPLGFQDSRKRRAWPGTTIEGGAL